MNANPNILNLTQYKEKLHKIYVDTNVKYYDRIEKKISSYNTNINICADKDSDSDSSSEDEKPKAKPKTVETKKSEAKVTAKTAPAKKQESSSDFDKDFDLTKNQLFIFKISLMQRLLLFTNSIALSELGYLKICDTLPIFKKLSVVSDHYENRIELKKSQIREFIYSKYNENQYNIISIRHNNKLYVLLPKFVKS